MNFLTIILINFFLLLRKDAYLCEQTNNGKKFDETSLLEKEDFYSSLKMEHITIGDIKQAKRVWTDFEIN